tara:strand:- start:99 stop:515 length:417 start_codon:yes stop_codon:yes gene_type:complete
MRLLIVIVNLILMTPNLLANTSYFKEGIIFYENNEFDKAKFKFEQDIVFNPKNEKSYLYLSKIFKELKKKELQEENLNTVILLNPLNEEANYQLAKLKLEESDFEGSKKLVNHLLVFCNIYCQKGKDLKAEIEKSLKK